MIKWIQLTQDEDVREEEHLFAAEVPGGVIVQLDILIESEQRLAMTFVPNVWIATDERGYGRLEACES